MIWQVYQKKTVVVGAMTAGSQIDMGTLGALVTDDYILKLASGDLHTLASVDFNAMYDAVNSNTTLTGTDWS